MKKIKIIIAFIALSVVVGLLFWAVQKNNKKEKPTTIGVILPLTGDAASYGVSLMKGLDIAFDGNDVKIIYEDSKGEPKTAVNAINKLINIDKADLLIGDMFTNTTMAIAPIAARNNILLLTPTASSSEITNKGETTFRLYPSEEEEGGLLFSFSEKVYYGKKGTVIVVNEDAMLKVANIINRNEDKQIIEYSKGLVDFTPIVQKIDKNTEVVFLIGYFEENVQLIKRSIEMNRVFSFIGLSTLYTPQLNTILGNIKSEIYISAPKTSFDTTNVFTADFIKKYRSVYNEAPDIWAGYGYDAGSIMYKVIKSSKERSTSFIREMYNINNFDGVTGLTTMNKDRSITKSMDIVEYADGKFSAINY